MIWGNEYRLGLCGVHRLAVLNATVKESDECRRRSALRERAEQTTIAMTPVLRAAICFQRILHARVGAATGQEQKERYINNPGGNSTYVKGLCRGIWSFVGRFQRWSRAEPA